MKKEDKQTIIDFNCLQFWKLLVTEINICLNQLNINCISYNNVQIGLTSPVLWIGIVWSIWAFIVRWLLLRVRCRVHSDFTLPLVCCTAATILGCCVDAEPADQQTSRPADPGPGLALFVLPNWESHASLLGLGRYSIHLTATALEKLLRHFL